MEKSSDVTIKDIAAHIGVSHSTVSRALAGKPGAGAVTRQRILDAAKAMGYVPNPLARGLVSNVTLSIGLIVFDITNPFIPVVARGVENAAREKGYTILLCDTNWDPEIQSEYLRQLQRYRVDGIVIAPISGAKVDLAGVLDVPVVLANSIGRGDHSYVAIDNERGGFLATKHLVEKGFHNIALVGGLITEESYTQRQTGYHRALGLYGIPPKADLEFREFPDSPGNCQEILDYLADRPDSPDAFVAVNDSIAIDLLRCLSSHEKWRSRRFGIVGFDDIAISSFPDIELTTIAAPKYDIGRKAFEILLQAMTQNKSGSPTEAGPTRIIVEPTLVERRTIREFSS
jgi:LacI family transcriptional regulator